MILSRFAVSFTSSSPNDLDKSAQSSEDSVCLRTVSKARGIAEKANAESTHGVQHPGRLFRLLDQTRCAPLGATSCSPIFSGVVSRARAHPNFRACSGFDCMGGAFAEWCTNAGCVNAEPYEATDKERSTARERSSELGLDAAEACAKRSESPAKTTLSRGFPSISGVANLPLNGASVCRLLLLYFPCIISCFGCFRWLIYSQYYFLVGGE